MYLELTDTKSTTGMGEKQTWKGTKGSLGEETERTRVSLPFGEEGQAWAIALGRELSPALFKMRMRSHNKHSSRKPHCSAFK